MSVSFDLFKYSEDSFLTALDEQGIQYNSRTFFPPGEIMASGAFIEIAQAVASSAALAGVAVAWIKARASRKIIITRQDGQSVHLEGYSVADAEKIFATAVRVAVIDTKPPDTSSHQANAVGAGDSFTTIEVTPTSREVTQQIDSQKQAVCDPSLPSESDE
jgi:hypothetical protein